MVFEKLPAYSYRIRLLKIIEGDRGQFCHELIRAEHHEHRRETDTITWHFATGQDLSLKKLGSRMLKTARFDGETFRELRDDPSATLQSVSLVAIIGLCYGAGLGLFGFFAAGTSPLDIFAITAIGLFSAIIIALIWSGTTFLIVTKLFRRSTNYWGLARPFFFSWAPGVVFILMAGPIPIISEIVRSVGTIWIGIASVFAVKNAVRISTQQSMLTFITSIVLIIFIGALVLSLIQFVIA